MAAVTTNDTTDDITDDIKQGVKTLMREGKHPAPALPNFGMRVSMSESYRADKWIHTWPVEEQAKHADMVCVSIADDAELCRKAGITPTWDADSFQNMNSTSFGNVAYLALHASDADVRRDAQAHLDAMCKWQFEHTTMEACVIL